MSDVAIAARLDALEHREAVPCRCSCSLHVHGPGCRTANCGCDGYVPSEVGR